MLPGMSGLDVCRQMRAAGDQTPILVVSARDHETDRVLGLEVGADDYLVKPFGMRELVARARALMRRSNAKSAVAQVLTHKNLRLYPDECRVTRDGKNIVCLNFLCNIHVVFGVVINCSNRFGVTTILATARQ
jgi:two-component system phosphate regulon response regulator PhoB